MLNARFAPIVEWPGKETSRSNRKKARFGASYSKTLGDLERELNALSAKNVVIQLHIQPEELRNDGWPLATARPRSPGVILTFQRKEQVLSWPCDRFLTWEQNLRAISLTLHALRMIEQYGVTRNDQQYKGFAQLESPSQVNVRDQAVRFIASWADVLNEDVEKDLEGAYKIAARRLHPDAGGSHDMFVQLQENYRLLRSAV